MMSAKHYRFMPLLILFSFLLLFSGCFSYKEVQFKGIERYEIISFSPSELEVKLFIKIQNPNPYNIKIFSGDLDVSINGNKAGKAKLPPKIIIKKNSEALYEIPVKATMDNLVGSGISGLIGVLSGKGINLGISGEVKARARMVSKKFPVSVSHTINPGKGN